MSAENDAAPLAGHTHRKWVQLQKAPRHKRICSWGRAQSPLGGPPTSAFALHTRVHGAVGRRFPARASDDSLDSQTGQKRRRRRYPLRVS